jgi:type I restriction enzyme S subunit
MSVPMKDSGVGWLGRTPAHWGVVQSRRLFGERNEKAKPNDQQLTVSQKYGLLSQTRYMELEGRRIVVVQKGQDILKRTMPGDFVISMRSFQGGLELSELEGSVSSAYVPITPIKWVVPRYFRWAFKSVTYIQALQATSDLVRDGQALRFENFAKVPLPVVPECEQTAIADFLDRATSRIDTLVARKTRFIELLRDKHQALIAHAVTQGLDAGVRMKKSTTASNLSTPSHWQVVNFWTVANQISLSGVTKENLLSVYLDRGVIPYSEGGGLVHKPSMTLDDYQLVEPGNFVLNNQQAWRGSVGVSKLRGIVSPAYLIFKLSHELDPAFANYQFRERRFVEEMMLCSQGVGDIQRQVKWPLLRYAKVFLPPMEEQRAIADYLHRATTRIDTLIGKTERSIELLNEHRIALITGAVTGKIDLRNAA